MPGSTPVFGFPYPDPSDLVANYPALGQQLAEDVEDEIIASGGMQLITTQSFSAVSAVNVNNCFTSTFQNYRVFVTITGASANSVLTMRMRAGGTDTTTGVYSNNILFAIGGATSVQNDINATSLSFASLLGGDPLHRFFLDVFCPREARRTTMSTVFASTNNAGTFYLQCSGPAVVDFVQYDGFTFYPASGTFTGDIRVYGYKN